MLNRYVIGASVASTFMLVSFAVYMNFIGNNVMIGTALTFAIFAIIYSGLSSQFKSAITTLKQQVPSLHSTGNNDIKEGLTMLSASNFSETGNTLLLSDWYPENKPFQPSGLKYDTMWKDYPSFPARSMKTNLIKYWDNPSNGTCMYPWQCDAFYKKIVPEKISQPTPPSWGSGVRVNFFDTCLFQEKE